MFRRTRLVILTGLLVTASACTTGPQTGPDPPPGGPEIGFGNVHGVDLNPADGLVYAATHYGVFRLAPDGPQRVADRYQDTMGFTIAGPDRFLGSGHPDLREPGPPHLGLIRSTDRAQSWQPVSLRGDADFHALSTAAASIYGWNSRQGVVMRSDDDGATWQYGATLALTDLDADPTQPQRVLAATEQGLLTSGNGGLTFEPAAAQPPQPLVLLDHRPDTATTLAGVDAAGNIWNHTTTAWNHSGQLPGAPQAFTVTSTDRYLAATDAGVYSSTDAGRTWTLIAAASHGQR